MWRLIFNRFQKKNGYTLAQLPGFGAQELGRITGLGALPHAGSAVAQEISMAIALTPMFQTVLERDVETPWVYYISANRFVYLYPQVSTEDYFFEEISLKRDYHRLALPEHNPTKSIYWTPAYADDGGKGMMVTVGAPVYQGDQFRGSLSVDIALSKLNWLLEGYDYSNIQLTLYDNKEQLLSQYPLKVESPLKKHVDQDGFFTANDTSLAYKASLKAVPWHLVATTSSSKITYTALWRTLPVLLVIVLLVAGLVLIKVLANSLKQVHELSILDGLTGVYNRRHFDSMAVDYLARVHRQGNFAGLVLLDLDFFKLYNDTHGHQAGDYALITIANILKEKLQRPTDGVFRVGGEEFAILTEAQTCQQILAIVNGVHEAIVQKAMDFPASPMGVMTASCGVYCIPPTSQENLDEVYQKADEALYRAKAAGRNRVEMVV